jgi:hypothetical protein
MFGLDVTPIIGDGPALCGQILDARDLIEAQTVAQEEKVRAAQCARDAQANGRAYVYSYRFVAAPDVDLIVQAVSGIHGEHLLLKMGRLKYENIRSRAVCTSLNVLPDGKVAAEGCYDWDPLLDRLRTPPAAR